MLSKQTISSKITIFGLIIFLIFMANLKYKQYKNQKAIETQKRSLLAQTESLQKKNNELNESLQYLNSTSFKERVAREQLNLKKDGEIVYSFGTEKNVEQVIQNTEQANSNFQKWWNYIFSSNQ